MDDEFTRNQDGKNHLLIIGIEKYQYAPNLQNCQRDCQGLIKILTEKYRFDLENVITIFDENATKENIRIAFQRYAKNIQPRDSLLIWFSGHGAIKEKEGYWVPADANPLRTNDFFSMDELITALNSINAFHIFLCVDACFSGSIFKELQSGGLGNANQRSVLGLAASHSKEIAFDGKIGDNSPFAKHFLKNLRDNEFDISVQKLSISVLDDVRRETEGQQNPIFGALDIKEFGQGQWTLRLRKHGTFVDPRDGKSYRTVKLLGKTWMAQNLDYYIGQGCWHYANDRRIGKVFGRLYDWQAAMNACPPGWRLPMLEEIQALIKAFESPVESYKALIKGGTSGFDAILGGIHITRALIPIGGAFRPGTRYDFLGQTAYYWTNSTTSTGKVKIYNFGGISAELFLGEKDPSFGFSVRCVQD